MSRTFAPSRSRGREIAVGAAVGWIALLLFVITLPLSPSGVATLLNLLIAMASGLLLARAGATVIAAGAAIIAALAALVGPYLALIATYPERTPGWVAAAQERATGIAFLVVLFTLGFALGRQTGIAAPIADNVLIAAGIGALALWLLGIGAIYLSAGPA